MQSSVAVEEDILVRKHVVVPDYLKVEPVLSFLRSKAADSAKTADTYCDALVALHRFLDKRYPGMDPAKSLSILLTCQRNPIFAPYSLLPWADIYKVMDSYSGYLTGRGHKPSVVRTWLAGVKGFYAYNDVDIINSKYKQRVKVPKDRKEDAYPLDRAEVRTMLLSMTNLRLKAFCTAEAAIGARPVEHSAVRYRDCDFTAEGMVVVNMRAEYSKNKLPRTIYWSQEAKDLAWRLKVDKYGYNKPPPDALVFSYEDDATPEGVYQGVSNAFRDHLESIGMNKTVPALSTRYEITLMSFRHYAETVIEDNTSANFADYILGHKKSTYYGKKEPERRKMFMERCAAQLTFFDYEQLEQEIAKKDAEIRYFQDVTAKELRNLTRRVTAQAKIIEDMQKRQGLGAPAPTSI